MGHKTKARPLSDEKLPQSLKTGIKENLNYFQAVFIL
jgi:hypothetical protein